MENFHFCLGGRTEKPRRETVPVWRQELANWRPFQRARYAQVTSSEQLSSFGGANWEENLHGEVQSLRSELARDNGRCNGTRASEKFAEGAEWRARLADCRNSAKSHLLLRPFLLRVRSLSSGELATWSGLRGQLSALLALGKLKKLDKLGETSAREWLWLVAKRETLKNCPPPAGRS